MQIVLSFPNIVQVNGFVVVVEEAFGQSVKSLSAPLPFTERTSALVNPPVLVHLPLFMLRPLRL